MWSFWVWLHGGWGLFDCYEVGKPEQNDSVTVPVIETIRWKGLLLSASHHPCHPQKTYFSLAYCEALGAFVWSASWKKTQDQNSIVIHMTMNILCWQPGCFRDLLFLKFGLEPNGSAGEESAYNARVSGDAGLNPGSGRSPGEGCGNPLGEAVIWLHQIWPISGSLWLGGVHWCWSPSKRLNPNYRKDQEPAGRKTETQRRARVTEVARVPSWWELHLFVENEDQSRVQLT